MGSFETFDVAVRRRRHGAVVAVFDLLAGLRRIERVAHVRANEHGLFLDGEHVVTADAIRNAYVVARGADRPVVVIETAQATVELFVRDAARGQAMLDATTLATSDAVAKFERVLVVDGARRHLAVASIAVAVLGGLASAFAVVGVGAAAVMLVPMLFGVVVLVVVHETPDAVVTVGADGIAYRTEGRERFFPHGAFTVDADQGASGAAARLHVGARKIVLHFDGPNARRAFLRRVADADARVAHLTGAPDAVRRLARGTRDDHEWLRAVRDVSGADYRSTAVPVEQLWDVVEDPSAPSSARAGAALGLHAGLDDGGRARLRVIAEACASPRLRIALDAAAASRDDDALERAVEQCGDDDPIAPRTLPPGRSQRG